MEAYPSGSPMQTGHVCDPMRSQAAEVCLHQARASMRSGTAFSTVSTTFVSYSTHCV